MALTESRIRGPNVYFIPRNVEAAVAHILKEVERDYGPEIIGRRATNLARDIWLLNAPTVGDSEGRIALANALAEMGQWIADHEEAQ